MQKRSRLWPACSQVTFLNQFVAIVFNGHAAILPLGLGRWEVCGARQYGTNLHSISHNQTGTPIFMVFPTCKYPAIWGSILGPRWASIIDGHPHPCFNQTSLPALPVGLWCLTSRRNGTKNQPLSTQHTCGKIPSPIWKTLPIIQFRYIHIYIFIYIGGFSISLAPILTWLLKSWFACLNPHALNTRGQWILGWSNDVFNGNHKF